MLIYMWQETWWKYATTPLQPSSKSAIWHTINGSSITHTQKPLASFIYLMTLFVTQLQAECTNFLEILESPHISWCQKSDRKQVYYWWPTYIRCHHTKCSCLGNLATGICALLVLRMPVNYLINIKCQSNF